MLELGRQHHQSIRFDSEENSLAINSIINSATADIKANIVFVNMLNYPQNFHFMNVRVKSLIM